jgi:hypothetical protein
MYKRLFILAFIVAVAANSVSAVSPQLAGERCVMSCCRTAQKPDRDIAPARLRCLVNCSQPASTSPSPASVLTAPSQKKTNTGECVITAPQPVSYIQHIRFPKSPTRFIAGNSTRYLETGTLLI